VQPPALSCHADHGVHHNQAREDTTGLRVELRPEPGVDPVLALRALLKVTLRRFGLRCISAHEDNEGNNNAKPNTV
jgi:hypothetical protein